MASVIFLVTTTILMPHIKAETQANSPIEDPTPSYMNLSEYMIGSCAVSIILPESNGTHDPSTEDWTDEEIGGVLNKTQTALDWWAAQNLGANVSFVTDVHTRVPTSYEPMDRSSEEIKLWAGEVMSYLGYNGTPNDYANNTRTYLNDLREKLQTDWAFMIFMLDCSNKSRAEFTDGIPAHAWLGGPYIAIPVLTIVDLDYVVAHEMGHIFFAMDEYVSGEQYSGYLNVTDIPNSGGLMSTYNSWELSGKPDGLNGTWGQIGWRDSDGDSVQDIVDTSQQVILDSSSYDKMTNTLQCTGRAAVIPYTNHNPHSWQRHNVTINKITSVQFSIDGGEWMNATIIPTTLRKEIGDTGNFYFKNTTAMVNFTFTQEVSLGKHQVEVKATNQWGNSGYANDTFTAGPIHDVAITNITLGNKKILARGFPTSINLSAANLGNYTETLNLSIYANATLIMSLSETVNVFWRATLTFIWNTTDLDYGNYVISANATQVPDEIDIANNNCTVGILKVTIPGDVNGDFTVGLIDLVNLAIAYGSKLGDSDWNPNADIDGNSAVGLSDLVMLAQHYGQHYP